MEPTQPQVIPDEPISTLEEDAVMGDEHLEAALGQWMKINGQAALDNWLAHSEGARASFLLWISKFAGEVLDEYMEENFESRLDAALSLWIQIKTHSISTGTLVPKNKQRLFNAEGNEIFPEDSSKKRKYS